MTDMQPTVPEQQVITSDDVGEVNVVVGNGEEQVASVPAVKTFNPADVKQETFSLADSLSEDSDLYKLMLLLGRYSKAHSDYSLDMNFDPKSFMELDAATEVTITPIREGRGKVGKTGDKMKVVGHLVINHPTYEQILAADEGVDWVKDKVRSAMIRKAVSSSSQGGSLPTTLTDFISSRREVGTSMEVYRELSREMLSGIKKHKLTRITVSLLAQCLQSARIAESLYPRVKQSFWEGVLRVAVRMAKRDGKSPEIFENWLANRDTDDMADVELDSFELETVG